MPEISRFYGVVIRMYWADHAPPHFHAEYGSEEAQVRIDPIGMLQAVCRHAFWRWWSNGPPFIVTN